MDAKTREAVSKEAGGKTVRSLEYVEYQGDRYWMMTFTDDSEICFRFMSELIDERG
jgi:hypothetical protein